MDGAKPEGDAAIALSGEHRVAESLSFPGVQQQLRTLLYLVGPEDAAVPGLPVFQMEEYVIYHVQHAVQLFRLLRC
jgi:hypothetical protein